ncbi:hypothetical protein [Nostoc sp. 106C]|uniref:hypothetical protein n=1 Tax=Nostoc sp. 106C TaxID=1932667 RepID=UPI00106518CE|nr:hypothetical protein [Nostoc sp. 106C]
MESRQGFRALRFVQQCFYLSDRLGTFWRRALTSDLPTVSDSRVVGGLKQLHATQYPLTKTDVMLSNQHYRSASTPTRIP